ncbi:MAG TPA: GIY-YIG nuclease family protein [Longimicrobiaceae bacterium]|nr:GIY-YIG nuclease family protein [Longimicrobiaceae bacterium]
MVAFPQLRLSHDCCIRVANPTLQTPLRELRQQVRSEARNRPGTYRMLAADGEVLYVGKSKQVRTRLLSYFRAREGEKALRIVGEARSITWEYEPSEFAALLRELQLIKRFRPRYNVQHKRDRKYSFLKLSAGAAPKLYVVPSVADDAAAYFGPFRGGSRIAEAVRELNDLLGLRDCALSTPMRFADQPDLFGHERSPLCHRYELQRCAGPCAALCTEAEYRRRIELARAFLDGDADEPLRWLDERMLRAAERWEFEYAASLRDRARRLEALREEFGRLREALEGLTFLYTVPGEEGEDRVYVIRRGTVRASLPAPTTPAARRRLLRLAEEHFRHPERGGTMVAKHQVDEILLLAHWFRVHPDELARTVPPAAAGTLPLSRREVGGTPVALATPHLSSPDADPIPIVEMT